MGLISWIGHASHFQNVYLQSDGRKFIDALFSDPVENLLGPRQR